MTNASVERGLDPSWLLNPDAFQWGLTPEMILEGARTAYATLDLIDSQLLRSGSPRLSQLVELANLSTIIGNLLANGIVQASDGILERAGPHKYQDLRAAGKNSNASHVEWRLQPQAI